MILLAAALVMADPVVEAPKVYACRIETCGFTDAPDRGVKCTSRTIYDMKEVGTVLLQEAKAGHWVKYECGLGVK